MESRVPARLSRGDGRRFGLTLGAAFIGLSSVAWWRGRETAALVAVALGSALLVAAAVVPTHLGPLRRAWLGLGVALSRVTTPLFLGVVYFGVITPTGFLLRLLRPTSLTRRRIRVSTWIPRPEGARSRRDMEHQF